MNYSTYRFTLDLQKHQSVMSVAVFQYDSAVRLHISLTDGGKPYLIEVSEAVFYGKRSDGTAICKKCTTIPGNAEIIYEFDALTAEVLGTVNCQIRLYGIDGSLISAPRFTIVVEPRVIDADDVFESEAEIDALDAIFATEAARITAEEERAKAEIARAEAETLRVKAELAREAAEEIRDRKGYGEWDHIITDRDDLLNNLAKYDGNILVKGLHNVYGLSQKLNEGARLIKFVDTTLQNVSLEGNQNCTIEGLRIVSAGSTASSIRNFGAVRDCNDIGGDPFDSLHIFNCNHIANCRFEHAKDCNYIDNCTVHTGSDEQSILLENCNYICGIVIEADESWDFDPKGIFQNCSYLSNINVNASVNREKIELIYNGCTYVDAQTCSQFIDGENVGMVQVFTEDGSFRAINPAEEGGGEAVSPTISVSEITGGHRLTITDANGEKTVNVMNGKDGEKGDKGEKGDTGAQGVQGIQGVQGEQGIQGIQGEKGEKGDGFSISKTYTSVSAMNAGFATDGVPLNGFVLINTGNVEDADNAKLFVKGESGYSYLTDLSGSQGIQGEKGEKGEQGIQGVQGAQGKQGVQGVQGEKGEKGDPYILNAADKTEIAENVKSVCIAKNQGAANVGKILVVGTDGNLTLADMPEGGASGDVIGTLDDSNNILLSGNLADGTYTLKYENEDGTYTEIGSLTVGEIAPRGNLADPTSADWLTDTRLATGYGNSKEQSGAIFTNYIPAKMGDVLRVKGLALTTMTGSKHAAVGAYSSTDKTADATGRLNAYQGFWYTSASSSTSTEGAKDDVSVNGDVYTYTVLIRNGVQMANSNTAYIRISAPLLSGYTANDVIITVNEEIV